MRRYIATQEAHHRKLSFIDELRELLNAAGIEFDEKYLLCDVWHPSWVRFVSSSGPVVFADSDHRLLLATPSGCGRD